MKTRLKLQLVLRTDTAGWSVIYVIPISWEYFSIFICFRYIFKAIRKYISPTLAQWLNTGLGQ